MYMLFRNNKFILPNLRFYSWGFSSTVNMSPYIAVYQSIQPLLYTAWEILPVDFCPKKNPRISSLVSSVFTPFTHLQNFSTPACCFPCLKILVGLSFVDVWCELPFGFPGVLTGFISLFTIKPPQQGFLLVHWKHFGIIIPIFNTTYKQKSSTWLEQNLTILGLRINIFTAGQTQITS